MKGYKPSVLRDRKTLLLLCLLVMGTLLAGRAFEFLLSGLHRGLLLPDGNAFIYAIPFPMGAMLMKLIFDFRITLIFSFVISLLVGIWFDDPLYFIYVFIGSLIAAFSVIRCRKRSDIIKGGIYVSAVNIVTAGAILLIGGIFIAPATPFVFLYAALSGVIVAAMVSILLPFIEYTFGITTDVSFVELLDLDQPLMRNLMIVAPGTYHHSVIVGSLAETAAEAVGVNSLLAKVAAYYHDIGKIKMPKYFIENQMHSISKHKSLTPHMSSMVLISHVKEGAEPARQHKLPGLVIDIMQQHHGTGLITYFYQSAVELATDGMPLEEDYRYQGPKPQTRASAIVMMADALEAASRTLIGNPTPARISSLVEK
ncbi:HDIG domain-containing protein [Thermodesulfovibrionales bacterium]|nr:HDIG domain-containing protein [Thermodesulfovibrionales bacterium]